ncbi:MAG: glycosyltransferase [Patescibacteria group bacterium]
MNISIIIPAYNAGKIIDRCLRALIDQLKEKSDWEIIVVDDGSTDNTKDQIRKFPEVEYLHQENKGSAAARNLGIRESKGEIILFIDADCEPTATWVEEMIKPFSDSAVMAVKGAYLTNQKSLVARLTQIEFEERYAKMKKADSIDFVDTYSAAFRKQALQQTGIFDEELKMSMDAELAFRVDKAGFKIVFNPQAKVYHQHPSNWKVYWKKKFWRAYWRMDVYKKYPKKIIKDSYTPQTLKFQIITLNLFLASLIFLPFIPIIKYLLYTELAAFLILSSPLILRAFKKGLLEGITMPIFLIGRSLALGLGILQYFNVIKEIRSFLIFILVSLVLILPSLFAGGRDAIARFILLFSILPLALLTIRLKKKTRLGSYLSWTNPFLPLALFVLLAGLSAVYSLAWAVSLNGFIYWLFYLLLFWVVLNLIDSIEKAYQVSYVIILTGSILSLIGLFFFAQSHVFHYLRLISTFYYHNPFGGFLLMVIPFSLIFFFITKNKKIVYLLGINCTILLTSLVLTHSRGSWVAISIPILIITILLGKNLKKVFWYRFIILAIAVSLASLGLRLLKSEQAQSISSDLEATYSVANSQGNAYEARINFFQSAYNMFRANPVLGTGNDTYRLVSSQYQEDARYYSVDPHNIVLKTMAELGVLGMAVFIWFALTVLYLFYKLVRQFKVDSPISFLALAAGSGLLGAMIHNLMDFDWQYPSNIILFVILLAILQRLYGLSIEQKIKKHSIKRLLIRNTVLALVALFVAFYGTTQLWANVKYTDYQAARDSGEVKSATDSLNRAVRYSPYDYNYYFLLADLAYRQNEEKDIVTNHLAKVQCLNSCHAPTYNILARQAVGEGDNQLASEYYFEAIACNPLEPAYYFDLAKITFYEKKYEEVITLADQVIAYYPLSVWQSTIWVNPNRLKIKNTIAELYIVSAVSQLNLGNQEDARLRLEKSLEYNPDNQNSRQILDDIK